MCDKVCDSAIGSQAGVLLRVPTAGLRNVTPRRYPKPFLSLLAEGE